MPFAYYVYILTNRSQGLYVGVTNNVYRRLEEHRAARPGSFTARYNFDRLIYVEETNNVHDALNREKQIKGWSRAKKEALIAGKYDTMQHLAQRRTPFSSPFETEAALPPQGEENGGASGGARDL